MKIKSLFSFLAMAAAMGIIIHHVERWFWNQNPNWQVLGYLSNIALFSLIIVIVFPETLIKIEGYFSKTINKIKRWIKSKF